MVINHDLDIQQYITAKIVLPGSRKNRNMPMVIHTDNLTFFEGVNFTANSIELTVNTAEGFDATKSISGGRLVLEYTKN